MTRPQSRLSRRSFLLAAGAGSAVATAALVAKITPDVQSGSAKKDGAARGYHVTEHIRNYYRTAKV